MREQDLATLTSRESNFAPDALPGRGGSRLGVPAGWAGPGKSTGSGDLSPPAYVQGEWVSAPQFSGL